MTTVSLAWILSKQYAKPVDVRSFRVISSSPVITLEVEIQVAGEPLSKTWVEITL